MAQHPKTCPSDLVLAGRGGARAVQQADATFNWGSGAREQGAKPPREPQSPAGQLKQARKPKEAQAKPLKTSNPKANLKKWTPRRADETRAHQKPLPLSQRPSKAKGTQNTPKICSFTTRGEGGFAAAIKDRTKDKKERGRGQQQLCEQPATDKLPLKRPHG